MAFQIGFYNFNKRENSTKRPASGSGAYFDGTLKEGSGLLNPTIGIDMGLTSNPSSYNYAYITQFGRYYFVKEWFFENALWYANLEVDVLATYKTDIGNAHLYVLRSADEYDGSIIDTYYPTKTGCDLERTTLTSPWTLTNCRFCVGIVSPAGGYTGSISHYIMTPTQLGNLCSYLVDQSNFNSKGISWSGLSDNMVLSMADPIQYIKSCVMLPVSSVDDLFPYIGSISCFTWNTGVGCQGLVLPTSDCNISRSFTIQKHDSTNSRGNYVNSAPYTSITLTVPPFGNIDIDTSITCNHSTLDTDVTIDPITGKGVLVVKCGGNVLHRIEAQVGVPISLSQVTRDYIGAVTGVANAVGSVANAVQGGFIGGAVSGAVSGIGDAVNALMPRANTIGTTGSNVSLKGDWILNHQFFSPVSDDYYHNGRPLCQNRDLNTLPGYQLIQDGDVTCDATLQESIRIKNYLETGYYYE